MAMDRRPSNPPGMPLMCPLDSISSAWNEGQDILEATEPNHDAHQPVRPQQRCESSSAMAMRYAKRPASKFPATYRVPPLTSPWLANLEALRSTLTTLFGLGWFLYSRTFKATMQTPTARSAAVLRVSKRQDLPNSSAKISMRPVSTDKSQRQPNRSLSIETPKSGSFEYLEQTTSSPAALETGSFVQRRAVTRNKDPDILMHALLRRHYKYLLPWISTQPEPRMEDGDADGPDADSYKRMTDEFRQLSLPHFTDLSGAIYRDVRRREDASPDSPQQLKQELWMRNRQNEARMVLCRTVNEHLNRLVTVVVLEQARRLAEIRIKIHRRSWLRMGTRVA